MTSISEQSNKAEIISAACEIVDDQAATIEQLRQQSRLLWFSLALALAWQVMF